MNFIFFCHLNVARKNPDFRIECHWIGGGGGGEKKKLGRYFWKSDDHYVWLAWKGDQKT